VLTTNDPVSIDTIAEEDQGQASGVSATAEQFGGALGIAGLYAIFHATYVDRFYSDVHHSPLPNLSPSALQAFRATMTRAETTGLRPNLVDHELYPYLLVSRTASEHAYAVTFGVVGVIAAIGAGVVAWLVRKPSRPLETPGVVATTDPAPEPA
jgi:hypothetical protein